MVWDDMARDQVLRRDGCEVEVGAGEAGWGRTMPEGEKTRPERGIGLALLAASMLV